MGRTRALTGCAAAAALLVAVLSVRGGTAAEEADLAAGLPVPTTEPSTGPSADARPDHVLVGANGLPGLRLGSATPSGGFPEPTSAGCTLVWDETSGTQGSTVRLDQVSWDTNAWAMDGAMVSVLVGSWSDVVSPSESVRTWLGPTLGSPIEAAQELPRARTTRERAPGGVGPVVTVVAVPGRGVEVLYSDLPLNSPFDREEGRITTIEVRRPEARACEMRELYRTTEEPATSEPLTIDADGVGPLRLGATEAELLAAPGVVADDMGGSTGCRAFSWQQGSAAWLRATVVEGVVTEVTASGVAATSFGLPAGATADEVRARFPELAGRSDELMSRSSTAVDLDGVTLELQLVPAQLWVPEVDRPFDGGPLSVNGVVVRSPGASPYPC